jgi:hypothetical protein
MSARESWPVIPELREEWEWLEVKLRNEDFNDKVEVTPVLLRSLYNELLVAQDAESRAQDARDNAVSAMRLHTTLTSAEQARAEALLGVNRRLVQELGALAETVKSLVRQGSGEASAIAAYSRRVQTAL